MKLTRYPFDNTGSSPGNLVENELHTLPNSTSQLPERIVLTREGAYYNASLTVKQGDKILKKVKDYVFDFFWQDVADKVGKGVSCGVRITNPKITGTITLTYQVVGGPYHTDTVGYKKVLATLPYQKPGTYWDEVKEKPDSYYPDRHLHQVNDVFGMTPLVVAVEDLGKRLEKQSVLKLKLVYDRFIKLKQYVEGHLEDQTTFKADVLVKINEMKNVLKSELEAGLSGGNQEELKQLKRTLTKSLETLETASRAEHEKLKRSIQETSDYISSALDNVENRFTRDETLLGELQAHNNYSPNYVMNRDRIVTKFPRLTQTDATKPFTPKYRIDLSADSTSKVWQVPQDLNDYTAKILIHMPGMKIEKEPNGKKWWRMPKTHELYLQLSGSTSFEVNYHGSGELMGVTIRHANQTVIECLGHRDNPPYIRHDYIPCPDGYTEFSSYRNNETPHVTIIV